MICALVLAAGESRRMGTQKLLLPYGHQTIIESVVDELTRSVIDEVRVVVGHESDRIARALSGRPISIVVNPDYRQGMLSSVRQGLRSLPPDCAGILVALGDQPGIKSSLLDKLVRAFTAADKGIVTPKHDGKRGHPILFAARYRREVLTHYDQVGLRGLLEAHPDDVLEVDVSEPAVLLDIDTPEDYQRQVG